MSVEIRGRNRDPGEGLRFTMPDDDWKMMQFVLHNVGIEVPAEWTEREGAGLAGGEDATHAAALGELSIHASRRAVLARHERQSDAALRHEHRPW